MITDHETTYYCYYYYHYQRECSLKQSLLFLPPLCLLMRIILGHIVINNTMNELTETSLSFCFDVKHQRSAASTAKHKSNQWRKLQTLQLLLRIIIFLVVSFRRVVCLASFGCFWEVCPDVNYTVDLKTTTTKNR